MVLRKHKPLFPCLFLLTVFLLTYGLYGCTPSPAEPAAAQTQIPAETTDTLTVGGHPVDTAVRELTLSDADSDELEQVLPCLPLLERLTLEGAVPPVDAMLALKNQFPDLDLICQIELGDKFYQTNAARLDLSGSTVSQSRLLEALPLFSNLQELILTGVPMTDSEKMTLIHQLPGVFVSCELPLAGQYYSTDSTQIDLSGSAVTPEEIDRMLPCFPRLSKLDLSFCGIEDSQMDALNQRHPETSIVWTLQVGSVKLRTDAVYFYPAGSNYYPTNEEMKKLRYCPELIAVDIGHTRATDCEFLWHTPKVKYLILADTGITDITPVGNLQELIYLELFNLKIRDYAPLVNCTRLQDLNIGTTYGDPEPLSKMTWLHNLQWHWADQNPQTREAVLQLPEQLPDTNVELYPKKKARNIGGPWRYLPNYYVFRDIIGAPYFNQDQIKDYWGQEDGSRIMACQDNSSAAGTLAEIVKERIDNGEPIIGIKNTGSEKARILYQTLLDAEGSIRKG